MPRSRPRTPAPQLDAILDRAADAFDQEQFAAALARAEEALALAPRSAEALHFKAAALVELERTEEAREFYAQALKESPETPELLLGLAELLISTAGEEREALAEGVALATRGRKLCKKRGLAELQFEFALLEGTALNQVGECTLALERLDEALSLIPASLDALLERGIAHFELCRFDLARADLAAVLEAEEADPFAHHYLGLIAERAGDHKEAKRRFARATELSAEDFPPPTRLSEAQFDQVVTDAVERLPAHVKKYLENTTLAVEPIPADEDLVGEQPPLSPSILGVFRGTPVGERSFANAADHLTASIVLYQRNLERFARSREELIEQIGITLMHEVGHLIGLDEEDLWERGLD